MKPREMKAPLGFQTAPFFTLKIKWKLKILCCCSFSIGVTNHVWTTDCLLTPSFSRGIYFMREGKKVSWKLIPMCLINGHWRMHSNLCTVQLFHFKPHAGNYPLLSSGVNVFVALSPFLTPIVLFSGIQRTEGEWSNVIRWTWVQLY